MYVCVWMCARTHVSTRIYIKYIYSFMYLCMHVCIYKRGYVQNPCMHVHIICLDPCNNFCYCIYSSCASPLWLSYGSPHSHWQRWRLWKRYRNWIPYCSIKTLIWSIPPRSISQSSKREEWSVAQVWGKRVSRRDPEVIADVSAIDEINEPLLTPAIT